MAGFAHEINSARIWLLISPLQINATGNFNTLAVDPAIVRPQQVGWRWHHR